MNYAETVEYLYKYLPIYQHVGASALKKNLNNTFLLLKALHNPHHKFKSVHIAGTNGKGSTAHTLSAILQTAGYKTGLYTSPHLKSFTERIKINGREIPEEYVVSFVHKIKPEIESIHPSFFEVTVAMAFDVFAHEEVDIAIVETGLGGRLDSTNVINPELSLITNIGFDHQAILGHTLAEIAGEKAGIIKPGVPVVIGEYQDEIAGIFHERATSLEAPLMFASKDYKVVQLESSHAHLLVDVFYKEQPFILRLLLSLPGIYQVNNVAGVLSAISLLNEKGYGIKENDIRNGFQHVQQLTGLKGRWQILQNYPLIVCDTGHNEAGITYVTRQLATLSYEKLFMVIGVANDKKLEGILSILPKEAFYYFCQAKIPRALEANNLADQAGAFGLNGMVVPDVNEAIAMAKKQATTKDAIFIGGSSFVVAEIEAL